MGQFFNHENMERFFEQSAPENIDLAPVIERIDFNPSFDTILAVIMESSFGPMLGIIGGVEALMPLKEPFVGKIKETLLEIAEGDSVQEGIQEVIKNTADTDDLGRVFELAVELCGNSERVRLETQENKVVVVIATHAHDIDPKAFMELGCVERVDDFDEIYRLSSSASTTSPTNSWPKTPLNSAYPLKISKSVPHIPAYLTLIKASPDLLSGVG